MRKLLARLSAISLTLDERRILDGLSFDLHQGSITGLLGPNGAGKSTCLSVMAGIRAADSGLVEINGESMRAHPQRAKAQLGFLPDTPPLYPQLRVDEFLEFCGRLHRLRGSALDEAIQRAKQDCDLTQQGRRLISGLSKGFRQRLGLAAAILHRPKVILLDEPGDGLDIQQLQHLRQLLKELAKETAILIASHQLAEVRAVSDRVLMMNRGRILDSFATSEQAEAELQIVCARAIDAERLASLPQIHGVRILGRHRASVSLVDQVESTRLSLCRRLLEEDFALSGFVFGELDLEQRYLRLMETQSA